MNNIDISKRTKGGYEYNVYLAQGYIEISIPTQERKIGETPLISEEDEANAAFICLACNNYDKLVETLKGFVNEQEQQQKAYFELSGDIIELDENILKAKQLLQSLENN